MGEKSVTDLIGELKKVDFDKVTQTILERKIGGLCVNSLDFLLDWKYEIVKVLCTQKLDTLGNEHLVDKFKNLDFDSNKSELMKALQNLKVAKETQKTILDNFVNQKGFESLDLKPFEQLEEECGTQVYNHDENKTIFLFGSNDFIKLCKVIWRIIKNTDTKYKNWFVKCRNGMDSLKCHMNRVFNSDTNKTFFEALNEWDMYWCEKLSTEKFGSPGDNLKAFDYCSKNDIFAYFYNLSRIKCEDTEYTEFAQRLELPNLDRKVVILTDCENVYAKDVLANNRRYNHRPANEIIIAQTEEEENDRRTTIGQNIKRFVVGLVNSLVKTWNNLSQKTKKIISGSSFLVFFMLWILAGLNILEIAMFMSLALSWTIAIISFIGMMAVGCMFTILITDDSENLQRELSNRNNPEIQPNLNSGTIDTQEKNGSNLNLDGTEPKNNLSSGLDK